MDIDDALEDPFNKHFHHDLSPALLAAVTEKRCSTSKYSWPCLQQFEMTVPQVNDSTAGKSQKLTVDESITFAKVEPNVKNIQSDLKHFSIKSQILGNVHASNLDATGESQLTSFQSELLSIMHNYKDIYYTQRSFSNAEQIRFVYCLHAVNHALKTRLKIIHHNARITDKSDVSDEFRDQGLVRPKILIVVPFKDSAFRIIKLIASILLGNENQNVVNKKRFFDEFSGDSISESQKKSKPEDFVNTFCGNTDDDFKIGITVTKKSLKLYADFYSSDIIVASPLGLRLVIGADGERDQDYDFLSSIEILILDQAEVFLMQNWDHVLHIMEHINLQPRESHGTDFSRVRSWAINGWTKYYRQNLIFSAYPLAQISALARRKCSNYAGCVRIKNPIAVGTISQVIVSLPHIFHRLSKTLASETVDERFDFFTQKILPDCQSNLMKHVLIYVPSYFDFVRLRNYFKAEAIGFAQICEYSKDAKVAQARDIFFHNEVNYMLYSERFHFFMRRKIRGIRHLIFYQLPTFPHFYSEMCNLMQDANQNPKFNENSSKSVTVIYSIFDDSQLAGVVSTNRASAMFPKTKLNEGDSKRIVEESDKTFHLFVTDDTN